MKKYKVLHFFEDENVLYYQIAETRDDFIFYTVYFLKVEEDCFFDGYYIFGDNPNTYFSLEKEVADELASFVKSVKMKILVSSKEQSEFIKSEFFTLKEAFEKVEESAPINTSPKIPWYKKMRRMFS